MSESKIAASHRQRRALVYIRQSSPHQVEHNRESTRRQYALADRARDLGWHNDNISVIDEDLGLSGATAVGREGFARMTAEVALGQIGILLGLEVSRLARNNSDWYRLLDLCGLTDTLIADADGIYHPGLFNDRLLLGLKGAMSEAELHILRARLDGGIRNKAQRGELYRGQPIGYVRGEGDAEILLDPDEEVQGAIRAVFERFAEFGSARRVWRWFVTEKLDFPHRFHLGAELRWEPPSYHTIHMVLTNPVYAGAYAYGKTRREHHVDESGAVRKRSRKVPRSEWQVLIHDHHPGYIDWQTHEAILERLASNTRPQPHGAGEGAVREGTALLQGIGTCGACGRRLATHYTGRTSSPGYHCNGKELVEGRQNACLYVGAVQIDRAVSKAVLEAIQPATIEAALKAAEHLEADHDQALDQRRLAVERARYEAQRAERRYRAVEPEHRLVARGLERDWEQCLKALEEAQAELERRERDRPRRLDDAEQGALLALAQDLQRVWDAPTTTARDKKELLRTVIEEVIVLAPRGEYSIDLTLRWRTGLLTQIELERPRRRAAVRTDEDIVDLVRRLARFHSDAVIASILNRQEKTTAYGLAFNSDRVGNLRRNWSIPGFDPETRSDDGELVNVAQAARILGVATSTVHRWLNDGFIDGEQITPGAPWRIRITDAFRPRFMEEAPPGYVSMFEAMQRLGVTRQTVLQRVKRGELDAIHIRAGRKKALRIKVIVNQPDLFEHSA